MSLVKYKQKRVFKKTPEPKGAQKSSKKAAQLRFVVQKHYASRLHFDFRLELDGVLKSWAVPKGPSLDPNQKRLAMMVEDHPLDYMHFEGTIPKGNYGAGKVIVWDTGVYHSAVTLDHEENIKRLRYGLKKGHLNIVLYGQKLKGQFHLVKLKDEKNPNAWILIKQKDEYLSMENLTDDDSSALSNDPMPHDIKPMLATLVDKPFNRAGWFFEIKWDGYRAIAEIENGEVNLYSRKGNSFVNDYPPIVEALKTVKNQVVFDGEIVALKDGEPDFHTLQNYDETRAPLQYVIFDLLYLNGRDLRDKPLIERKEILKNNFPKHPNLLFSEHIEENGLDFFKTIRKENFEGMIAKDSQSIYLEGRRGESWLKIKHFNEQEAIIVGFTDPRGSRKKLGALVLAAYDNDDLKYIGHSGGGFTQKELAEIYENLNKIRTNKSPLNEKVPINSPITWVKPKYVCQAKFSEWTPDGRMRHPIYAGIREDKDPKEVIIERPSMAKVQLNKPESKAKFTNLDKVFWPKEKYTKGDVIKYYEKISKIILPYLKDRPESLHRHPNGIEGSSFFHKDIEMKVPDFVETKKIWSDSNEKEIRYLLCQNKETLLYLANLGCIELNPWNSRIQSLDKPDYMIIDLDPGNNSFDELVEVTKIVHEILIEACEESFVKTSGKRGLHIMIPVGAKYTYETIRIFSQLLVNIIHERIPKITSIERNPAKRRNKIYLDYLQNRRSQTIAAPYSLRPVPGATVSTPLEWKEVKKGLDPKKFTIETIFKRLERKGDLWKDFFKKPVDLDESIRCLEKRFGK